MKFSTILIALILFGGVFAGMYAFVDDLGSSSSGYGVSYNESYTNTFKTYDNISNDLNTSFSKITDLSANTESSIGIITLVPEILIIVKDLMLTPFELIWSIQQDFTTSLGLPNWVSTLLISIAMIILIFGFISLVLRWNS